jgi:Ser/Thr protein kinase RdoA (MazF antagonist)
MSLPEASPPSEAAPAHSERFLLECLRPWGIEPLSPPRPVDGSALNYNYRVDAEDGTYFLRIHKRSRTREQLETEHAVIAWAGEHGIPVNPAIPSADGRTLRSNGGSLVAVFPWVEASTLQRATLDEAGARLLGETLGTLQTKLRPMDIELRKTNGELVWDTEASIGALSRVDDLIRYYPAPGEERLRIQEAIRFQMELLESQEPRPSSDFEYLVRQPCHSDFHERNVLVREGEVVAVVDWERVSLTPPIFELMRALTFCWSLDDPLVVRVRCWLCLADRHRRFGRGGIGRNVVAANAPQLLGLHRVVHSRRPPCRPLLRGDRPQRAPLRRPRLPGVNRQPHRQLRGLVERLYL